MRVLKELELRRSLLLEQREQFSLFNSFYGATYVAEIDSNLFWLSAQINKVKRNKLFYIDNPQSFEEDFVNIDSYINNYRELLS